jgi:hypothetical protein
MVSALHSNHTDGFVILKHEMLSTADVVDVLGLSESCGQRSDLEPNIA